MSAQPDVIVIFFLAHAGIHQPRMWREWRKASAHPELIRFRVFCPPAKQKDVNYAGPGARRLNFFMATEWGGASLVQAQQGSYREILDEFGARLRMIFMVSGADIPVMSADNLLDLDTSKSYFSFTTDADDEPMELERISKEELTACGLQRHPKYQATQWIHVTRQDAEIIANFNIQPLICWLNKLREEYDDIVVPDETFPWAMLQNTKVDGSFLTKAHVFDDALTDQEREASDSPSPILWTDLNTPRHVHGSAALKSLRQILLEDEEDGSEGYAFFRKVAKANKLDLHNVFAWYSNGDWTTESED